MTDTCVAGVCAGMSPVTCVAADQCHDAGVCDPTSGTCSSPAKMDGATCDDGDPCTLADTCVAGACASGTPMTCTAMDQCHDPGTCDPTSGVCDNPPKMDGTACDDGDLCTPGDTCAAGACVAGTAVTCAAMDPCHDVGTCDPTTGVCGNPAKTDGAACDDGNACTQGEACLAGVCAPASKVTCTAMDECHTAGTCDATSGLCDNPLAADGSPCTGGACAAGACVLAGDGGSGGGAGSGGAGPTGSGGGGATSSSSGTGGGTVVAAKGCGCEVRGAPVTGGPWAVLGLMLALGRRASRRARRARGEV
jgi:hypothetical protein